ncbi:MAG TPA: DUF3656 domain-containing protein, partial [Candidatus Methanoperedens sp.]
LRKLGGTIFEAREIRVEMDDNIFIQVSEINSLRRSAVSQLERTRMKKWKRLCNKPGIFLEYEKMEPGPILSVNTGSIECLEAAAESGADVVYTGGEFFEGNEKDDYNYALEYGRKKGVKVYFSTPRIVKDMRQIEPELAPDGFLISNMGALYHLQHKDIPIIADYPFNVLNVLSMRRLLDYCLRVTLSPELTLNEIRNMTSVGPTECIVHGFFPLMVSEHDLIGGLFPAGNSRKISLKDEKGFVFPVREDSHKRTYIMNSRELCMLQHVPDLVKAGVNCLRIEAKSYDAKETRKITGAYRKILDRMIENADFMKPCREGEYTTGHYFRGVI